MGITDVLLLEIKVGNILRDKISNEAMCVRKDGVADFEDKIKKFGFDALSM